MKRTLAHFGFVGLVLIVAVAVLYPAAKAAAVQPVDAMRHH